MDEANGTNGKRKKKIRRWQRKAKEAHTLIKAINTIDAKLRRPFFPFFQKRKNIFQRCPRCGGDVDVADLDPVQIGH